VLALTSVVFTLNIPLLTVVATNNAAAVFLKVSFL
jgi:hypothetical protein